MIRPRKEDYSVVTPHKHLLTDFQKYCIDLEEFCDVLEKGCNVLEKALDSACYELSDDEYTGRQSHEWKEYLLEEVK